MPEPTAPAKEPSLADKILKSIDRVITPEGIVQSAPTAPPEPPKPPVAKKPEPDGRTLGEIAFEIDQRAKAAAKNPPAPPAAPPVAPPTPLVTPPVVPEPPKLKKREAVPPPVAVPVIPPVVVAPVVTPPAPPAPNADDAFIATLTPEQKDELQMAEFAESKFPELKGKKAETLAFFKKVDQFSTTHPDQLDSDEFKTLIESSKPKWTSGQKRKVETAFITQEATKTAREEVMREVAPQLEAQKKKIHQQEVAPLIDEAIANFEKMIVTPKSSLGEIETIPEEVVQAFRDKGNAAIEDHPIAGPIFARARHAAREWLDGVNGNTAFSAENPTHKWLLDFLTNQGNIYRVKPESVRNGRQFMPLLEFLELSRSNPTEAGKYWTFDDEDVLNLIDVNANLQYNDELSKLKRAGFTREKKKPVEKMTPAVAAPTPVVPPVVAQVPPPEPPAPPSPRSRTAAAPGAAIGDDPQPSFAAKFIDRIAPGSAARLKVS